MSHANIHTKGDLCFIFLTLWLAILRTSQNYYFQEKFIRRDHSCFENQMINVLEKRKCLSFKKKKKGELLKSHPKPLKIFLCCSTIVVSQFSHNLHINKMGFVSKAYGHLDTLGICRPQSLMHFKQLFPLLIFILCKFLFSKLFDYIL